MKNILILIIFPTLCHAFGSVAIDRDKMSSAYTANFKTEKLAIESSKRQCPRCSIIHTFENSCAAIARGYGGYGVGVSKNLDSAKELSLADCKNYADYCYVVTWSCDSAL